MKHIILIAKLMLLLFVISCSISCNSISRNASPQQTSHMEQEKYSQSAVSSRVLVSLKSQNWTSFCRDAAPDIVLEQVYHLSSGNWPRQKRAEIFPDLLFGKDIDAASTIESSVGTYSLAGIKIPNSASISEKQLEWFKRFCRDVNTTYSNRPDWIESGEYLESPDTDLVHGPAIRGKLVSSDHWYVAFTYYKERWVVNQLIRTAH